MKNNLNTKHFTRGGQVTLHNIRMWIQISNKILLCGLIIFILVSGILIWINVSPYHRYIFSEYLWSQALSFLPDVKIKLTEPNGHITKMRYADFAQLNIVKTIVQQVCIQLFYAAVIGGVAAFSTMLGVSLWLRKRGEQQTADTLIKGDRIEDKESVKRFIFKKKQHSDLALAGLPLIKNKETAHSLFHGTTGTGKSNGIKELLDQIRERGDRAVLFDKSCNFLEEFYQPKTDLLLNALDSRTQNWDLWKECRDSADFDNLAAAMMPMPLSDQDPFWVNAARMIFSSAAFEMRNDDERSVIKLLRYLLTSDLDILEKYLKGTVAELLVSKKIEKTAINIKSVLATYLRSLKYVREGENPLSIRGWIQNKDASNWLFVTSLGDRHETIKPLISSWLDIAVNALLSLPPDNDRRIWFILDELTSLHKLPYLTQALAEARKFGGCAVLGLQNYAQLQKIYGINGAKEISSLLNTRFLFRQPDPDLARWSAENFGETIVEEVHEGISYGANTLRDGISINRVETRKPLISFSEIMSLSDLSCYVRLPGGFPVTKLYFTYKKRSRINQGFIMRHLDENKMKEIDELIERETNPFLNKKDTEQTVQPVQTQYQTAEICTETNSIDIKDHSLDVEV